MNKILLKILFLLIFSISYSQTNSTLEMAKSMSKPKVEIKDLTDFVSKNISDKRQIAKFYYYWISLNIDYDSEKRDKLKEKSLSEKEIEEIDNPYFVFGEKKGICSGYSSLFKLFMDLSEIECEIISGYTKNKNKLYIDLKNEDDNGHAWNSIKINSSWLLVDTTWAKQYEEDISDYYFDTPPKKLILSHFPDIQKWQILENPISINEFNKQPYVSSFYFDTGFSELPNLTQDDIYYYIEFQKISSKNWLTKLTYDSENKINESIFPEYEEKQNSNVFKFKKDKLPEHSVLNVVLGYFDWKKHTKSEYNNIIKYQL